MDLSHVGPCSISFDMIFKEILAGNCPHFEGKDQYSRCAKIFARIMKKYMPYISDMVCQNTRVRRLGCDGQSFKEWRDKAASGATIISRYLRSWLSLDLLNRFMTLPFLLYNTIRTG